MNVIKSKIIECKSSIQDCCDYIRQVDFAKGCLGFDEKSTKYYIARLRKPTDEQMAFIVKGDMKGFDKYTIALLNSYIKKEEDKCNGLRLELNKLKEVKLIKRHNHDHFWIEDQELYESYMTNRGLRYGFKMAVNGMPDVDRCDESCISYIEKEYLN